MAHSTCGPSQLPSAQQNIDRLFEEGVVTEEAGRQRNRVWVAGQMLRILGEDE